MRIGFIGLGVMGAPMAENLIAAGHELTLYRVKERHRSLMDAGAVAAESARAAAERSDVVLLMLPDTPDVESVLHHPDGVLAGLQSGSLVMDMSSISPVATRDFATAVSEAGADYVDAPVSGGESGAKAGTLTIFAGGTDAAVKRAMPLLEILGTNITHMGEAGTGQATKVANQVIVGLTIEAVAEGLAVAKASGLAPAQVREALSGGFASSKILQMHGQRMVDETFEPGFRLRLHRKDLGLALSAAEHYRMVLPGVEVAAAQMDTALDRDWGELDHSALFKVVTGGDA